MCVHVCARTRGRIALGLRTFFTLQTHQQKEEEDLRGRSGFAGLGMENFSA